MRRREFLGVLGGAAAALPFAARAQQMPVIGYLGNASPDVWADRVQAFRKGLAEAGFAEGRNVTIEFRWANGQYERLKGLADDLVQRGVNVIVTPGSTVAALVAKAATSTIPIVFEIGGDPVAVGLVASLNRPSGNVTGVTALSFELGPKRLQVLREIVPSAQALAALVNRNAPGITEPQTRDLQRAARDLGVELHILHVSGDTDFDSAFVELRKTGAAGLVIAPDVLTNAHRERLAALALRDTVPAIFQSREFALAGGLISYGGNIPESHRLAGLTTGRVLKGEKPADLPVVQATKVEMIVNLKTAKAFGINVPLPLLGRADEVIE
jgi:putative ABC transport system substrate-binding protein